MHATTADAASCDMNMCSSMKYSHIVAYCNHASAGWYYCVLWITKSINHNWTYCRIVTRLNHSIDNVCMHVFIYAHATTLYDIVITAITDTAVRIIY